MSSQISPAPPRSLVEAASAGGFLLTEEGGQPIMDAIGKVRQELEAHRKTLDQIDREPYLSNTLGGKFVSEHARLVASGDEQSLRECSDRPKRSSTTWKPVCPRRWTAIRMSNWPTAA